VDSRFEVGAVCRALSLGEPSGDAWTAIESESLTIVAVDGVGHGAPAHEAAVAAIATARASLERDPLAPLDSVMQACHSALRGSRGAAVGLCRFEPERGSASYCGVGNTTFLRYPARSGTGVSLPGIVGWRMRTVRVFDTALAPGDLYAFHSDGIGTGVSLSGYVRLSAQQAAEQVLREHGKISDDALIVVVRFRPR
jgi:hypothetical protein